MDKRYGTRKKPRKLDLLSEVRKKNTRPDFLRVTQCGAKGYGVITTQDLQAGTFVLYYSGEYTSSACNDSEDEYTYEIQMHNRRYFIDARYDLGYAKFINDDSHHPNLRVQIVTVDSKPVPSFITRIPISAGTELTYNYGPGRYPWRMKGWVPGTPSTGCRPIFSPKKEAQRTTCQNPNIYRKLEFPKSQNCKGQLSDTMENSNCVDPVGDCTERDDNSSERVCDSPERFCDSPDQVGDSPERDDNSPERVCDSPDQVGDSPERDDNSPERVCDSTDQVGDTPERDDNSPERVCDSPDQVGDTTERDDNSPERDCDSPNRDGQSPETGGKETEQPDYVEYESDEQKGITLDPTTMRSVLEVASVTTFHCQLCLKEVGKAQILRHLRNFHKCHKKSANFFSTNTKRTKRSRLTCNICGKLCTTLTHHLKTFHNISEKDASELMKISKKTKLDKIEMSDEFWVKYNKYVSYCRKSLSKFKGINRFMESSHFKNIVRIANVFNEIETDIVDLLEISPDDTETEECLELTIVEFTNFLSNSNKSPDTAVVYLNDLKKFIRYFYRFNRRIPLIDFIAKLISDCKKARKGKMNLNKYLDRQELVEKLSNHFNCPLAVTIRDEIANVQCPAENLDVRNYLMVRLLIENIQRSGAICHMTIEEFNSAIKSSDKKGRNKFTIVVSDHKTASINGPANIHAFEDLYEQIKIYVKFFRAASDCTYVFVTAVGNAVSNSCSWSICQRHLKKCNIGLAQFNANSWRRAGNTVIQETGNASLIEATARQLTHSREQGRTTYYNDVSAVKSSRDHSEILEAIFTEPDISKSSQHSHVSPVSPDDELPKSKKRRTGKYEKIPLNTDSPKTTSESSPSKLGRKNRYFRESDRKLIKDKFSNMMRQNSTVNKTSVLHELDNKTYKLLTVGRTVKLTKKDLSGRIANYLLSLRRKYKKH